MSKKQSKAPKKRRERYVDDGRTIANMNVEGMPWYNPAAGAGRSAEKDDGAADAPEQKEKYARVPEELSGAEKRAMLGGVLGAAMLVAAIFIGVFFLFILFCSKIWLS